MSDAPSGAGMHRRTFSAMGVEVELLIETPDAAAAASALTAGEQLVHELAARFTRFDTASELMQLNADRTARVSDELFELVELALQAREATGGRFDPTLHDELVAAGYDRTFADLALVTDESPAPLRAGDTPEFTRTLPTVELDAASNTITLGDGAALDLGAIAKGYIADEVCALLADTGAALVNAGGDIACSQRTDDQMWSIEVDLASPGDTADAHPNAEPLMLSLDAGGMATSGITRRRWHAAGGTQHHHVIDPLTGQSVRTDIASVTVIAADCTTAEVQATALLIAGAAAATAEAQAAFLAAVICCVDGHVVFTGPLA